MIYRALVYGIVAHLLLGWALLFLQPPTRPKPRLPPVRVEIHIDEPKPQELPQAAAPSASVPRSHETAATPKTSPASPPADPGAAVKTYDALIPKAATGQIALPPSGVPQGPGLIPTQQFKEHTDGVTRQRLMIDASSLSAAFDVPLRVRRNTSGVEAFVRIERDAERQLRIVDLHGDPMLRAVIYESLLSRRVKAKVHELLDALEENTLPITLQALMGAADRMQDESDVSWIGRRLIIRKSAPPQSRAPDGGMYLPDEHAKKAIIRDRLEFERYQRSPAYRAPLQNYSIPDTEE